MVASNWDLTLGYAGIFNFAHVAFFGIGSYVAAISTLQFGVPVWWDLLLAVVVVRAQRLPRLALRQRGIYVALVTFAVTQLCVALINSQKDITGGPVGLIGVPDLPLAGSHSAATPSLFLLGRVPADSLDHRPALARHLQFRPQPRRASRLRELRDEPRHPGARQRVMAIVASSIPTSLAGCLYAHYLIVASPDVFSFSLTTLLLSMVLVGGAATIYGPISLPSC